jgi:hypothetical protein
VADNALTDERITKSEANYRPSEYMDETCENCSMWRDGACTAVKGRIEPDYMCDLWDPDNS